MNRTLFIVLLGVFIVCVGCAKVHSANDVPRITKQELKAKLGSPDLVLLDVRTRSDWEKSEEKITGALRVDPETVGAWIGTLPEDREIVLYCA
jgi:rhodanese-related sulfurtransferase